MKYLLNTNICAFFLRGKFDIDQEIDKVGWKNCYISEITVLELKYGVELSKQKDGINREPQLEQFLSNINIVPITGALSLAAQEKIRLRLAGTPADDDFDLLIGCTSVAHRMTMVTDNTKDFKNFNGIILTNWVKRP